MADNGDGLLRWENEALAAMMEIRWTLNNWEDPKERHIRILRTSVEHLIEQAGKIRAQQIKEDKDEYGE